MTVIKFDEPEEEVPVDSSSISAPTAVAQEAHGGEYSLMNFAPYVLKEDDEMLQLAIGTTSSKHNSR